MNTNFTKSFIYICLLIMNTVAFAQTTTVTPEGAGTVNVEGISYTAVPSAGYYFSQWSDGVTDNPREIEGGAFTAEFVAYQEPESYIDLGLPSGVVWAPFNLGATKPTEDGQRFAWGETAPKSEYTQLNYTFEGNPTELLSEQDAVSYNLQGGWSMPTDDDMYDLMTYCEWSYVTSYVGEDGAAVNCAGYIVKSNINGKEIFLPFLGTETYYWSKTLYQSDDQYARNIKLTDSEHTQGYAERYRGFAIRPVKRLQEYEFAVGVNSTSRGKAAVEGETFEGRTVVLTATPRTGHYFLKWDDGNTSARREVLVHEGVKTSYTAIFERLGTTEEHEYVDLGLGGLRWAKVNIGATTNKDMGATFATAETATKSLYDWSSYTFADYDEASGVHTINTYFANEVVEAEDDAATTLWGDNWRTPTNDEIETLIAGCDWTPVEEDGKMIGYKGTSKKVAEGYTDEIFLPMTGYSDGYERKESEAMAYYMSSTISSDENNVQALHFNGTAPILTPIERYKGLAIRPVLKDLTYTIKVESESEDKGSVAIGEENRTSADVKNGDKITIKATPEYGYVFKNWTYVEAGKTKTLTTSAEYEVTAWSNITYTAHFELEKYDITVTAVDENNELVDATFAIKSGDNTLGTTSAKIEYNTSIDVVLTSDPCYNLVSWVGVDGGTPNGNTYSFTVTSGATIKANLEHKNFKANLPSYNGVGGTLLILDEKEIYHCNDEVIFKVTAADGYTFLGWDDDGDGKVDVAATEDGKRTFTVTDLKITTQPIFELKRYTVTASALVEGEVTPEAADVTITKNGEEISSGAEVTHNDVVVVTVTPQTGYEFVDWGVTGASGTDATVDNSRTYTYTVGGGATINANLKLKEYTVTASVNPTEGGTITGGDTYEHGKDVEIKVTPEDGYVLDYWEVNGSTIAASGNSYTITSLDKATEVVAHMKLNTFTITTKVSIPEGGTIELNPAGGTYTSGTMVTATLTLNAGYQLDSWTGVAGGTQSGNTYTFTVTSAATIIANVSQKSYSDINFTVNNADWGSLTTSITSPYPHGAEVTLNAIPKEGYYFKEWSDGNKAATRVVTIPCASLRADFAPMAKPAVFAYDLKMQYNATDRAYAFTFSANTDATAGNIIFYQADGTMLTTKVAISSPIVAGKNTVVVPLSSIPFSEAGVLELNWGVEVSGEPITAMEDMYRETTNRYGHAYVAVDNSPESDAFGSMYVMHYWAKGYANNSIFKYSPLFGRVGQYLSNKGLDQPGRIAVDENGRVYISERSTTHSGVYVTNPPRYNMSTALMEGTIGTDGLITNGGNIIGGPVMSTFVYGTGKDAKLYVLNMYGGGTLPTKGVAVYSLGNEDGTLKDKITSVPERVYTILGNANGDRNGNVWATSHGFFVSFHRTKNQDVSGATSLQFYDNDGRRQYSSAANTDEAGIAITGSIGGGFAVSADEKTLVLNNDAGEFLVFDITWTGNKPTLTLRERYTHNLYLNQVNQMAFDYAGNLIVGGEHPDNGPMLYTRGFYAYVMPKADNRSITPAKKALVLECKDIIFVAESGTWNTAANWNTGVVPPADEAVVIEGQCTVNSTEAIQEVTIDGGKLIIAPTGALTIETTIVGADKTTDVLIQANASSNGTLIMKGYTEAVAAVNATVQAHALYTTDPLMWNSIGVPAEMAATSSFYGSWLCNMHPISKEWEFIVEKTLQPFTGYIITQNGSKTYSMSGKLAYSTDRNFDLEYSSGPVTGEDGEAGDNFLANSWTAPIYISNFVEGDFVDAREATVWKVENGGSYVAYPIRESEDNVIKPMEGFFVKTDTESGASLFLDYDRLVGATAPVSSAPAKRVAANQDMKQTLNILVNAGRMKSDKLRLIQKGNYTAAFDNGADATKMLTGGCPNLSVQSAAKELGVLATNNWDSTLINFRKGDADIYTLSFEYDGVEELILKDFFTGNTCEITLDATYSFEATNNDMGRFAIFKKQASGNIATNLQDIWVSDDILFFSNPASERTEVAIYSTDGKLVQTIITADTMTEINVPAHGVYLIKLTTPTTTKTIKQIF